MSKYGKFWLGAPDYSQEVAALKDLLEKGEIDKSKYNIELSKLQRERMLYIVATNGGYTPSKKQLMLQAKAFAKMQAAKESYAANRNLAIRDQFIEELKNAAQGEPESPKE